MSQDSKASSPLVNARKAKAQKTQFFKFLKCSKFKTCQKFQIMLNYVLKC